MRSVTGSRPTVRRWYGVILGLGIIGLAAFGSGWLLGVKNAPNHALAGQLPAAPPPADVPPPSPDYANRVVAYIYGNIPITREELGEYLIAREGTDKLDLLVNKRIVEHASQLKGMVVTPEEIEAALAEDIKEIKVNRQDFIDKVLKQYHKSLYEWKEDVIKPRLLMSKLCRGRVKAEPEDIDRAFENHYGEKIQVRILLYPGSEEYHRKILQIYDRLRSSPDEFDHEARTQPNGQLAAKGGEIEPIRHYSGNQRIEQIAFGLRVGELSEVITTPEGYLLMKCVGRIPPDATRNKETEREGLIKEIIDEKVRQNIPGLFKELRDQAKPNLLLTNGVRIDQVKREVEEELRSAPLPGPVPMPKSPGK